MPLGVELCFCIVHLEEEFKKEKQQKKRCSKMRKSYEEKKVRLLIEVRIALGRDFCLLE